MVSENTVRKPSTYVIDHLTKEERWEELEKYLAVFADVKDDSEKNESEKTDKKTDKKVEEKIEIQVDVNRQKEHDKPKEGRKLPERAYSAKYMAKLVELANKQYKAAVKAADDGEKVNAAEFAVKITEYFEDYFTRIKGGTAMWYPDKKSFIICTDGEMQRDYLSGIKIGKKWNLAQDWGNALLNPPKVPEINPHEKLYYTGKSGTEYFNMMPPLLHENSERKKLEDYPGKTQKGVKMMWKHIEEVLCSNKKDQFEYVQKWIAHVVNKRKMKTALYISSLQGIGKGIFCDFLVHYVLGEGAACQSSDSSTLEGKFNAPLMGKPVYIQNEAKCGSKGDWQTMTSNLKTYITDLTISIEKKYQERITVTNITSFIFCTNDEPIHAGYDDRRYVFLDASAKKIGDVEYFNMITELAHNYEVGEAFYWDCIDIAERFPKFNEAAEKPITAAFKMNVSDNLDTLFKFIKEEFILDPNSKLDMSYTDFYDEYAEYVDDLIKNHKSGTRPYLFKKNKTLLKLEEFDPKGKLVDRYSTKHKNKNWISMTRERLLELFQEKNMISDTDEFKEIKLKKSRADRKKDKENDLAIDPRAVEFLEDCDSDDDSDNETPIEIDEHALQMEWEKHKKELEEKNNAGDEINKMARELVKRGIEQLNTGKYEPLFDIETDFIEFKELICIKKHVTFSSESISLPDDLYN